MAGNDTVPVSDKHEYDVECRCRPCGRVRVQNTLKAMRGDNSEQGTWSEFLGETVGTSVCDVVRPRFGR